MSNHSLYRWSLALVLAAAALAGPADAQDKKDKKDKRNDRVRPELVRRDDYKAREKALKQEQKDREKRLKEEYERRQEALRRDRDRWESRDRRDDRYEIDRDGGGPPFCRNGQGHPVHGRRWCDEKGWGLGRDGRYDDRYEDRRNDRRDEPWYDDRDRSRDRYGSYDREHDEFHRVHDRQCRSQAGERPLDIRWQIRVRRECKERHDDWHYRAGRSHG